MAASKSDAWITKFYVSLEAAGTHEEASAAYLDWLAPFGIDTFACGEVDLDYRQRCVFHALAWPDSWREFYVRSGLVERDPVVSCLPLYSRPFTWGELSRDRRLSQAGSETLRRAAAEGWKDGLIVQIPRGGSRYGLVSFASRVALEVPAEREMLASTALSFHNRARFLAASLRFPIPPAGLTAREIDCLALIAVGAADAAIAAKLGISVNTVREHVEKARKKLVAKTKSEAVGLAVSLGIVVV